MRQGDQKPPRALRPPSRNSTASKPGRADRCKASEGQSEQNADSAENALTLTEADDTANGAIRV